MRKYLFTFIMLLPLLAFASAAEGDAFYSQGSFAQALDEYEKALKSDAGNPYLYYNIGNCYFKMGSLGRSLAYYARAFELNPRNADIRQNYEFALSRAGQNLVPAGAPAVLHKAFFILSPRELAGVNIILFWLLCFTLVFYIFKRGGGGLVYALTVMLVLAGFWYVSQRYALGGLDGVTVNPVTELKSGPGDNFETTAALPEGYFARELDSKDDWILAAGGDAKGWVKRDKILRLRGL